MRKTWIVVAASLAACGSKDSKKEGPASGTASASATGTASASAVAVKAPDAAPAAPPAPPQHIKRDEAGRGGFACAYEGIKGDGDAKSAWFKVTTPKEANFMQAWIFYYDDKGAYLDRYPNAIGYGDPAELAMGFTGKDMKKEYAQIECEITAAKLKDGSVWQNKNLLETAAGGDRPKGGVTDADLKAMSGEKVTVEVLDAKTGKVKLTNVSDKTVTLANVDVFHFHDDGTFVMAAGQASDLTLAPKASVEQTVDLGTDEAATEVHAAAANTLEATAPTVNFDDDSSWTNPNLRDITTP